MTIVLGVALVLGVLLAAMCGVGRHMRGSLGPLPGDDDSFVTEQIDEFMAEHGYPPL